MLCRKFLGTWLLNALIDLSVCVPVFQLKKVREKLKKCRNEVESSCNVYHASLSDLNGYNAKYIEDVTEVGRCGGGSGSGVRVSYCE